MCCDALREVLDLCKYCKYCAVPLVQWNLKFYLHMSFCSIEDKTIENCCAPTHPTNKINSLEMRQRIAVLGFFTRCVGTHHSKYAIFLLCVGAQHKYRNVINNYCWMLWIINKGGVWISTIKLLIKFLSRFVTWFLKN